MSLESKLFALVNIPDQLFNLKFASKQMGRMSKKSEKKEKEAKTKLKQVFCESINCFRQLKKETWMGPEFTDKMLFEKKIKL